MNPIGILTQSEAFILSFLTTQHKGYGLEMVQRSEGLLKRGSVYVVLKRMQKKGYVTSTKEASPSPDNGPPRRHYSATAKGAQALDAWKLFNSNRQTLRFTLI